MSGLKITFDNVADGKTAEIQAAVDVNEILENHAEAIPLGWK